MRGCSEVIYLFLLGCEIGYRLLCFKCEEHTVDRHFDWDGNVCRPAQNGKLSAGDNAALASKSLWWSPAQRKGGGGALGHPAVPSSPSLVSSATLTDGISKALPQGYFHRGGNALG